MLTSSLIESLRKDATELLNERISIIEQSGGNRYGCVYIPMIVNNHKPVGNMCIFSSFDQAIECMEECLDVYSKDGTPFNGIYMQVIISCAV